MNYLESKYEYVKKDLNMLWWIIMLMVGLNIYSIYL